MIICEAFFVIFGLYALLAGRIRISGKHSVVGTRARVIGLILIAPVILAFCGGIIVPVSTGSPLRGSTYVDMLYLEIAVMSAAVIAAIVLSTTAPETPAAVVGIPSGSFPVYSAPPTPTVMTVQEVADYLRVTPAEISQLIEVGQITARQIGLEYRISKESLDNFLNKR